MTIHALILMHTHTYTQVFLTRVHIPLCSRARSSRWTSTLHGRSNRVFVCMWNGCTAFSSYLVSLIFIFYLLNTICFVFLTAIFCQVLCSVWWQSWCASSYWGYGLSQSPPCIYTYIFFISTCNLFLRLKVRVDRQFIDVCFIDVCFIQVYDWDEATDHDLIGHVETTLNELESSL